MNIKESISSLPEVFKKLYGEAATIREKLSPDYIKGLASSLLSKFRQNKESKRPSLISMLSLSFVCFSTIILIVLLLFQTLFFDSFYKAIKTKNLTTCASSIINNIDHTKRDLLMETISVQNDIDVILCTHDVYANYRRIFSSIVYDDSNINGFDTKELNDYFVVSRNNEGSHITAIKQNNVYGADLPKGKDSFVGVQPNMEHDKAERLIFSASFTDSEGTEYLLLLESVITPSVSVTQTLGLQLRIILVIQIAALLLINGMCLHQLSLKNLVYY